MKPAQVKTRLQRQIEETKARREQAKIKNECEHIWNTVEESLPINSKHFKKSNAYFVFRVCSVCGSKRLVDYAVE